MSAARTLHITNGDSAAGTMNEGRILGDILPWRDVLHDGPVPGGLSLSELSRVRATFLAKQGFDEPDQLIAAFAARDEVVERYKQYEKVVLWFEWDLYDQLQLLQLLDFFAGKMATTDEAAGLEIVSHAGYLGTLPPEAFQDLYAKRAPVTAAMLSLGQTAWRAVTSSDPRNISRVIASDTSSLPFLEAALIRFLEELPWTKDGLARSERQLLEGVAAGKSTFGDLFQYQSSQEERIYCGDASAANYLERLASGESPLLEFHWNGHRGASRGAAASGAFRDAELALTETGKALLENKTDWISLGGSDRWLGGVHLEGPSAAWRWNPLDRTVREALPA